MIILLIILIAIVAVLMFSVYTMAVKIDQYDRDNRYWVNYCRDLEKRIILLGGKSNLEYREGWIRKGRR